ncbi:MAG: hypothetical protein LBG65_04220 [Puniceicoccales bacterium]|nr:hypothetical protein [Puniceicoccales bacterium]
MKTRRIPVNGAATFGANPFATLDLGVLPDAKPAATAAAALPAETRKSTKKPLPIHLRIEKAGRGGKTVTVLYGPGIESRSSVEQQILLKTLKGLLGAGGSVGRLPATLEVQGDERQRLSVILAGL